MLEVKSEQESQNINIPLSEYIYYIRLSERIDLAIKRMENEEFCKIEEVLMTIGTDKSMSALEKIKEKERLRNEEYEKQKESRCKNIE